VPRWRPSQTGEELAVRRGQLVERMLVGLSIATVVFGLISIAGDLSSWWVAGSIYGILLAGHLFAIVLTRQGRHRLVAVFYVGFYFAIIAAVTFFVGGISEMHAAGFITVTLLAGLTISARAGVFVAVLSLGTISLMGFVETVFGLPPSPVELTLWSTWTSHAANLLAAGLFTAVAIRGFEQTVEEVASSERSEREARESLERVQGENERRARQGTAIGELGLSANRSSSLQDFIEELDGVFDGLLGTAGLAVIERRPGENQTYQVRVTPHENPCSHGCGFEKGCPDGQYPQKGWRDELWGLQNVAVVPLPGDGDGLCAMLVVFNDPRELSQLDWLLFESTAVMLGSLFDRQSAEALLRRAQRMEAVGRLAGAVAHDFNNLLTSITLSAALAQDATDPEEIDGCIRDVLQSAAQASQLTKRLLSFSRKNKTKAVMVDLNQVIRDFLPVVRRMIGEDIVVGVELCAGDLCVLSDPAGLEQIVLNLAINARDAMADGGEIWVSTRRHVDDQGEAAVLGVRDSGSGIAPELIERIFDPFFTTKDDGTGLGLATVHAVATGSGGHIAVHSEPGEGTRFSVFLPLHEHTEPVVAQAEALGPTSTGLRVLVVDDQPMIRRTVGRILGRSGYTVVEASSAQEGIEAFENSPFDVVLTDVVMPRMKGDAMVARLREIRSVPVVFMSGYTEQPLDLDAERDRFIAKPFTPSELLGVLDDLTIRTPQLPAG